MSQIFAIYVPVSAAENLEVGIRARTWGLKDGALDRGMHRAVAQSINAGDTCVFAHRGPNSRVAPGGWQDAQFARIHVIRFSSPMRRSTQPIWNDDVYPNRLPFQPLETVENPERVRLSTDMLEALRLSANTGGVPHRVAQGGIAVEEEISEDDPDADADDRTLGIGGDLDEVVKTIARREQRMIRQRKFGNRSVVACDVCGRQWPRRFLTAAHIKRRREADEVERRDLHNIMAACPTCDLMFEWGHITVGTDGRIRVEANPETNDLAEALHGLRGRAFPAYQRSAVYFAWHEENRFRTGA